MNFPRKWTLATVAFLLTALGAALNSAAVPNVVMVLTDDQGYGDVGIHGNDLIATPNLDRLAREGRRMDRFFVSPVCAPTRASLLTGRYHLRTGVHGVTRARETMRSHEYTLAEAFRDNGYTTGCFGKWHNGAHFPHSPNGQGFDRFVGFCAGHWNNYFDTDLEFDGEMRQTGGFMVDVITREAMSFISRAEENRQPFFCYLSINTPHTPWQVPDEWFDRYRNRGLSEETACAYAMVEHLDHCIGKVRDHLTGLDLHDNTIFIFLTDNGANSDRFNAGMRGRKGSVHEGGMRVPFFIHWPGHIEGGEVLRNISCHMDVMPTLASLCELRVPAGIRSSWDGLDLTPLLMGRNAGWTDRMIFQRWGGSPDAMERMAVRTEQWRAVFEGGDWQLYNMQVDPGQNTNLADGPGFRHVLNRLVSAAEVWHADVTSEGFDPIPTEVGHRHPSAGEVRLQGHEAMLMPAVGKGIRYNGRAGWANDWVDGWTSPQAFPEWPIDVVNPGAFEVILQCSIPESSVGLGFTLESGTSSLNFSVDQSFAGTQIPSPDRIPRKEVYQREWKQWHIGTIMLSEGRQNLKIRAGGSTGGEFIDIKAVVLKPSGL